MWKTLGLVAFWMIVALAFWASAEPAHAQAPSGSKTCATCHTQPTLATRLANGATLSLYVDTAAIARSIHGQRGLTCADCHGAIAATTAYHPASTRCQAMRPRRLPSRSAALIDALPSLAASARSSHGTARAASPAAAHATP